jgi:hypothetical protein
MFILEPGEQAKAAIGKRVVIVDYPDGSALDPLPRRRTVYRTFNKIRQVSQARSSRTNSSAPRSPSSATGGFVSGPTTGVIVHRGAVISTTLVCLKSVERFYEPGVLRPAR